MNKKISILLILSVLLLMVSCRKSDEVIIDVGELVSQIENNENVGDNESFGSVSSNNEDKIVINETGMIYLYGELHGKQAINDKELELWNQYYHKDGMRHLFIEWPYFTAELLNVWMSGEDDEILKEIILTDHDAELAIAFLKEIKKTCPDTIFHGTDVGHSYLTVGIKYRHYLEDNDLEDTEMYLLNEEAIKQGKYFHGTRDDVYRENKMVENFTLEFNKLNGQSVMGIYGSAHVSFEDFELGSQTMVSMGYQLNNIYEKRLQTVDLSSEILKNLLHEPISIDQMEVAGNVYEASYFGKMLNPSSKHMEYLEYWQLDNAYEDLKNSKLTDKTASSYEYPMIIEENQIYIVIATFTDGSTMTFYALSDGEMVDGMLITKQIVIGE